MKGFRRKKAPGIAHTMIFWGFIVITVGTTEMIIEGIFHGVNLSLLGLALLVVHVSTAVLDEYVDIRWWNAVVPWGSSYEPVWVAVGALATDLMLAVAVLTVLRARVGQRIWRTVHLTAYASWVAGLAHGVGVGTDTREQWVWMTYLVCGGLLAAAVAARSLATRVASLPHGVTR